MVDTDVSHETEKRLKRLEDALELPPIDEENGEEPDVVTEETTE